VPVLVDEGLAIWDSLAIIEYVAEKAPDRGWPRDARRGSARAVSAPRCTPASGAAHALPMNIEASLAHIGALVWRDQGAGARRRGASWACGDGLLEEHKGPMLFGEFSAADAFYAPVRHAHPRLRLPVPGHITDYVRRVCAPAGGEGVDGCGAGGTGLRGVRRALPHRR
jgi:glutathione S-transferase